MQNRHGIYAEWKPKCSQDDNTIDIFVAKFRSIRRFRQKYLHRISQLRQFDFSAPISYPLPDAHVLTVDDLINLLHRQNYSDLNWQDRIKVEMGRLNVLNQQSRHLLSANQLPAASPLRKALRQYSEMGWYTASDS